MVVEPVSRCPLRFQIDPLQLFLFRKDTARMGVVGALPGDQKS